MISASRIGLLTLVALLVSVSSACTQRARKERKKLTLYCAAPIKWCELIKTRFSEETGIRVAMSRKSSGETYAQVWAEKRSPRADVWFGGTGDSHLQAAEQNLTEPYASPMLSQLQPWAQDPGGRGDHRMTGLYRGVLGFSYNTEWAKKRGITPPRGWKDLLRPEFRGELQMANPNSSGTAYTVLATVVQLFGEEEGFAYLRKLHRNINQYTKSGSAPVKAAGRGETGVGISFLHDATTQKVAGFPIEIVTPIEGTGYEIGGLSVIRGARHPKAARRFVDWALSAKAQALAVKARAYQIPSNPKTPLPEEVSWVQRANLIPFELARFGKATTRKRLLRRWDREVKGAPR